MNFLWYRTDTLHNNILITKCLLISIYLEPDTGMASSEAQRMFRQIIDGVVGSRGH